MDYNTLLEKYEAKACIISVEFFPDGTYGNIRVIAGNQAHCDDMAAQGHPFVPGSPYEACFPKNPNFEDYCNRCIRSGHPLHAYVDLYDMGLWLNMFLIPLKSDGSNIGHCFYVYDVSPKADSASMADLSGDIASNVLKACIRLRGSDNPKKAFKEVTEDIREICDSELCSILLVDDEKRSCTILGDAIKKGIQLPPSTNFFNGSYDITSTWPETLAGSTCLIIKDKHDMDKLHKQNPLWAESLISDKVETIVLFPLRFNNKLLGYMWAMNFNAENTIKIKKTLELTTFFLASEIATYKLMNKLEIMSTIDSLTGIKNRNMMNNRVDQIVSGKLPTPDAVFFIDLNGLKRVNDEQGHSAGDNMISSAAKVLQDVFHDGEIYRAGGDEFMAMIPKITEAELQKRIDQVHETAKSHNIHFSIGTCLGEKDIRKAMHMADERMYADKNAYYEAHPEEKYR